MKRITQTLIAASLAVSMALSPVHAHTGASEASAMSVAVPIASVASVGVGTSIAAAGVVAVPAALSVAGATLVVKTVEVSATGVVCVLERASDGARVSLDIAGRSMATVGVSVGTAVSVTVLASGTLIVSAGEAIAFIPNTLGRALTHNERL
ncbi:MAG: hypothetical protein ACRCWJ_21390 [Casimicrobium sp.]